MKKIFVLALLVIFVLEHKLSGNWVPDGCNWEYACASPGGTFLVGGDWIYFRVEERKLAYGEESTISENGIFTVSSKKLRPDFKWTSGFRGYGTYVTSCNKWKISLAYTYVPTKANRKMASGDVNRFSTIFPDNIGILEPIRDAPASSFQFSDLSAKWKSHLSYLDLDLAYGFTVCECLEIKPHIGFRGLWMHQSIDIEGSGDIELQAQAKGRLKGFGLEGGLLGALNLNCGFSIVAQLGGSLVYSKNKSPEYMRVLGADLNAKIKTKDTTYSSIASVDSFVGLVYVGCLCDTFFDIQLGWEHHVFMNVNQLSTSNEGNLFMQGLTLGASVGF